MISTPTKETLKCTNVANYKNLVARALATLNYIDEFPTIRNAELEGGRNTSPGGKENLELRLKELDANYAAALNMFEANKKIETTSYEITLLPKSNGTTIPLASFSKICGLYRTVQPSEVMPFSNVPQSDKDECNSTPNVEAVMSTPPQMIGASLSSRISDSLDDSNNTRGIYYRVPETSRITIKNDTKDLLVKDVAIAQFGKIASLPAQTGSSNVTYKVTLDPVTGMLLKVSISSEAANTSMAKDLIDPVGDYLKARKDSNDELTQLQREEALLKTKKSIKDLKDAMGQ